MKNLTKFMLLGLVISVAVSACEFGSGSKVNSGKTPIDSPKKNIDTGKSAGIDTSKKDTSKKM